MNRSVLLRRCLLVAMLAGASLFLLAPEASATTFTVNSVADDDDGSCDPIASGDCTLQEAIEATNTASGADDIAFDITPNTIPLVTGLPDITGPLTIDGTTDPDPGRIRLDGTVGPPLANGLTILSGNVTVKGLEIVDFGGDGIFADVNGVVPVTIGGTGADEGNVLAGNAGYGVQALGSQPVYTLLGNIVGLDADGTTAHPNDAGGALIDGFGSVIGGTTGVTPAGPCTGACNLISGNGGPGLTISVGAQVKGNFIGTDDAGTVARGNTTGLTTSGGTGGTTEVIGGTTPAERNVISGNTGNGIALTDIGAGTATITGSYIGVGADGTTTLGNGGAGLRIGGDDVTIGGDAADEANVIANNGQAGVVIMSFTPGTGNAILRNSIYDNAGLGIDLEPSGVTPNDPQDPDAGANNLQNFPTLDSVVPLSSDSVKFHFQLDTVPNSHFYVEYFVSDSCDPSGSGEGTTQIGATPNQPTNASGFGDGNVQTNGTPPIEIGDFLTATATRLTGFSGSPIETSEFSPCLEVVPETFTVNSTNDPGDGTCDLSECTLREAIVSANGAEGLNPVEFEIPGSPPHTIAVTGTPLPSVTDPVLIDGTTDANYAGGGPPVVELDGTALETNPVTPNAKGLWLNTGSDGSTITGLTINDFPEEGILVFTDDNTITNNQLGTDDTGLLAEGNFQGLRIGGGTGNVVGGTTVATRNVISGNDLDGVEIQTDPNTVQGNYIGVGRNGTADVGNGTNGVAITFSATPGAPGNLIGGTAVGAGNLIAGNSGGGIELHDSDATTIQGNTVGLDSSGADRGNDGGGIAISDAVDTLVGGTTASAGNTIGGNGGDGVALTGPGTSGTLIQGNRIGTDPAGAAARQNDGDGIRLSTTGNGSPEVASTTIGGTAAGAGNLISANTDDGVDVAGPRTSGITIQGNTIGLTADGEMSLGNGSDGVEALDTVGDFLLGGSAGRNVISGNGGYGANLHGFLTAYQLKGNFIGTDDDGVTPRPNSLGGVLVQGENSIVGGPLGTTAGGPCTGECNLISGNSGIGLTMSGTTSLGGQIVVQGNYVGTTASGVSDLGNGTWGVRIGTENVTIGGSTPSARNVIGGNNTDGLALEDAEVTNVAVTGNYVGVGADGTTPVANTGSGIRVRGHDNAIGGTTAGAGNTVANNGLSGIFIFDAAADENEILGNSVHDNGRLGIDLTTLGMVEPNDDGDPDAGANQGQNYPVIDEAVTGSPSSTVTGTVSTNATTQETVRVELFSNGECDSWSGTNGEGENLLESFTVMTNTSGVATFSRSLGALTVGSS